MKEYDIYLFDFDGTLFDSLESLYPTFRRAFDPLGIEVTDEQIEGFTHQSLLDTAIQMGVKDSEYQQFAIDIMDALDDVELMKLIKPYPETLEVLATLRKRGKRLAIVSNNATDHIATVLKVLGIPNVFDTIVGSDRVVRAKPYPDLLFTAFDDMGVKDASRACYVGDSLQDGDTAVAGGIGSIIVDRCHGYTKVPGDKVKDLMDILDYPA